ncbi:MAG: nucleotidyltransferase domain-containing protein [Candidatus Omnitrophica bacterium]|nr:nucleotidyltransferase domain-containing protein [Candidatus Omnitrophota bacterium]MCM8809727.1 nucleotidyltransferase domain-containing protein [Candidatus Omnitrophota bacterium]MCM8811203.1 nucleotidyltransferase domain-containing protein [Candidatus Omnitrophota bacterium]
MAKVKICVKIKWEMELKDKSILNNLIEKIKKFEDVLAIILFGSYAKGNAKEISDIAVVLKDVNKQIESEIKSIYSKKFDVVLFHRLALYIKYGKEIFCRDEEIFVEIKGKF